MKQIIQLLILFTTGAMIFGVPQPESLKVTKVVTCSYDIILERSICNK